MALDATTAVNIVGSKITVHERFIKLYRKLHNLFLKRDFVNVDDFELVVQQINAQLQALRLAIIGHTHNSPFLGLPTGPGIILGPPPPPVKTSRANAELWDTILQATGEPVVPVGDAAGLVA